MLIDLEVDAEKTPQRLADSIEMALHEGDGFVEVGLVIQKRKVFSENFASPLTAV
ncbi:hypothetical protein [Mesotoga sp.]|uniref:hypothetical protein n=1 Tax=Mesotoga sp. TaxID=2053577 RepID=UPI00345F04E6